MMTPLPMPATWGADLPVAGSVTVCSIAMLTTDGVLLMATASAYVIPSPLTVICVGAVVVTTGPGVPLVVDFTGMPQMTAISAATSTAPRIPPRTAAIVATRHEPRPRACCCGGGAVTFCDTGKAGSTCTLGLSSS